MAFEQMFKASVLAKSCKALDRRLDGCAGWLATTSALALRDFDSERQYSGHVVAQQLQGH